MKPIGPLINRKEVTNLNPSDFLKTIYLGDRYCTKIIIDSNNNHVEIHVNLISRIRDESGNWNFYTEEDIENGILVFTDVNEVHLDKSGLIPNDQIYNFKVNEVNSGICEFIIETSHVDQNAITHDLVVKIIGKSVYLVDPQNPDFQIIN